MPQKPHFEYLKDTWTTRHKNLQEKLFTKHAESFKWITDNTKHLTAGTLTGILMLSSPVHLSFPPPHQLLASSTGTGGQHIDKNTFLVSNVLPFLPSEIEPLTGEQEQKVSEILSRDFALKVVPEIDGKRLNRSYGYIGAEQHLMRYPGDTMYSHFDSPEEANLYTKSGMAPGRGAWGYFANSKSEMTQRDIIREKYYIAVPTFMAPGFLNRVAEYRDFFKYRKMLVVNPETGKSIVADIADSGPAVWTGKHLGGSPEVMEYLERKDGKQKGAVLYFFIQDPNDSVPLGPISVR